MSRQLIVTLVILACGLLPARLSGDRPARLRDSLRSNLMNRVDLERIERGYYEQLLDPGRRLDDLADLPDMRLRGSPSGTWSVPLEDSPLVMRVDDVRELALKADRRARATLWSRETVDERHRIDEILQIIRLTAVQSRLAGRLSHGQKQWLEIGMLLAQDPKLLLVDEPVAGMTDVETQQTAELLKEINREHTVVVVEHDMTFVRELGVKVTCLHEGSVLAEGTIDEVSANERVVEVYLGR